MLTRNYQAIAEQTHKPFSQTTNVRAHRSWSWNPKHRKPSKVKLINPVAYDKEKSAC